MSQATPSRQSMTQFRRYVAHPVRVYGVLAVLTLAWAAVVFEPCCQAVAAARSEQPSVATQAGKAKHARMDSAVVQCPSDGQCVDARAVNPPMDAASAAVRLSPHSVSPVHVFLAVFERPVPQSSMAYRAAERTSPVRLYLQTQRLRD